MIRGRAIAIAFALSLVTLPLLVVGCRRDTVVMTPEIPEGAPPPPPPEPSQFGVPLDYDFTAVMRVVERAVPATFGSLDSVHMVGDDPRKHYVFVADRAPFTAYADGSLMHLKALVAYTAKAYYKPIVGPTIGGGCGKGEQRPRVVIDLATPLTLTADWHLQSKARLESIAPASTEQRDRCDVSFLHHDVTDHVVDAARAGITAHLADIDKKVASIDLRDRFSALWTLLARPIRLTDGVWLMLGPERLDIGKVTGKGHVLTVPVLLSARPQIVASTVQPSDSAVTLPPLGHAATADGFRVVLDGIVDYPEATKVVSAALLNKSVTQGGKTVTVTAARVTPANKGRLALTVEFVGDARGTLVFLGTPKLDSVRREITVPDLDYDLETDDQLINTYAWLKSDALRETFREKAHVPVDPALVRGKELLLSGLNRKIGDALTLSATVDSVAVRALFVTRAGVVVRAEARGHAAVKVQQH